MIRRLLPLSLLVALGSAAPATEQAASRGPALLAEAQQAAKWLRSVAIKTDTGLAWAGTPGPNAPLITNLYSGSAGVVLFFLELHHASGDAANLATARAGADWLVSQLDAERDTGLYTGLAGLGFALTETWKATKDARYRDAANRVVNRLKASARLVGDGVEWSPISDIISGTSGTGLYLLSAARDLGRADAKALAIAAGRRLLTQTIAADGGVKWAMSPANPTRLYPNFSHGTAGVAYFLATLAQETGEPAFRESALAGARYLLKVAKTDGDVCLVFHHEPEADGLDLFYLGWCHGPAGTARLFHRLAAVTGDRSVADVGGARRQRHSPERRAGAGHAWLLEQRRRLLRLGGRGRVLPRVPPGHARRGRPRVRQTDDGSRSSPGPLATRRAPAGCTPSIACSRRIWPRKPAGCRARPASAPGSCTSTASTANGRRGSCSRTRRSKSNG